MQRYLYSFTYGTSECNLFSVRERPAAVPEPGQAAVQEAERSEPGPLHAGGRGHELSVSSHRHQVLLFTSSVFNPNT